MNEQVLSEKNTLLSQELEKCQSQLRAAAAEIEGSKKASPGNILIEKRRVPGGIRRVAGLTVDSADKSGVNPEILQEDEQRTQWQQEADERVLTRVRQEKNDLQDANIRLSVELKDVRAQLADSVKENKRLRRGIFSKCLNELLWSSAKKPANRVISVGMLTGRPAEEMPGSAGDLLPSSHNCTNKFGR